MAGATALISDTEFKRSARINSSGQDTAVGEVVDRASDLIKDYLGRRHLVSSGSAIAEYHTMEAAGLPLHSRVLVVREWPIISITTIHEDTSFPRTYGAAHLLVDGTGYQASLVNGRIYRLSSGNPTDWATGHRAIKVVYSCGYANTAAVPNRIKDVCVRLARMMWAEYERGTTFAGISSITDQAGSLQRFSVARLTEDMKADLSGDIRSRAFETGELDA